MNRSDFPWIINNPTTIYFDSAATSHKPQQVIDAISDFYCYTYAPVYRSIYAGAEHATEHYEQARNAVAAFLNARTAAEIIFVKGATEGINFVAATWGYEHIKEDDEIVLTQMEHHSNLVPWQWIAEQKKAKLTFIPVTPEGVLGLTQLDALITEQTKLVAVASTSNALGTRNELQPIIARAHAVGAKVLVDACQSVPHEPTDVQKLQCDFLVFSGHKMMGPTGSGVLYIKKELHDDVPPYQRGGGMVREVSYEHATWLQAPQKFEAGTPLVTQAIGLAAAIDYYTKQVDFAALQRHEASLTTAVIEGLQKISGIRLVGPVEQLKKSGHSITFVHQTYHPHDIAALLDSEGVSVRAGHFCAQPLFNVLHLPSGAVRASFFGYNTYEDVERFLSVMSKHF